MSETMDDGSSLPHVKQIVALVEEKRQRWIHVSDQIWEFAETRFEEYQSANLLCESLEEEGFTVHRGVGNIETAFIGEFGSGHPIIAILGEFDALSGLSQQKGVATPKPVTPGGNGHGCGHNLLGTGSLAAAVAVKEYLIEHQIPGTIRYYGCPGEEGGSGKTFMARAGLFDDIDVAICWHPMDYNGLLALESLANYQVYFRFKGRSSHAAASPELGRSALDAVELMNVGVNYLREHIIPEARVHYAVTNTGGLSPNVVQADAEVLYLIRAPQLDQVREIYKRICNIARGAALMTETEVEIIFDKACSNLLPNHFLEKVMFRQYEALGVPEYSPEEWRLAERIQATLTEQELAQANPMPEEFAHLPLATYLQPIEKSKKMYGSTDVGDVSWIAPTVQCAATCFVHGSSLHSWQWVALGATSIGHKGMLHAGKVMGATAVQLFTDPTLIEQAKKEWTEHRQGKTYQCPIPEHVQPSPLK
jgi:aminobenzoyl-glutamate utilization protein B